MKTTSKKIFLFMMLAILLAPAAISAKVYFLEAEDESAGALNLVIPCRLNYPLTSCSDGKVPQNYCPTDNRYFQTCGCDSTVYQYDSSNCTDNKTLGGTACDGKYASCSCDATKYMYDSTNCGEGKVLGGNSCDGKYETCGCDSTYTKTCSSPMVGSGSACDGKYQSCTCPSGYLNCSKGGATGATSCTEEDGTVKYSSCKTMTCEDHGYVSSYHPDYNSAIQNYIYETVYIDGLTCYKEYQDICSVGGYESEIPSGQTCTAVTYNGQTCYKDCGVAKTCETEGYESSIPSNQTCTSVTYNGQTCYKNCYYNDCDRLLGAYFKFTDSSLGLLDAIILETTGTSTGCKIKASKAFIGTSISSSQFSSKIESTCQSLFGSSAVGGSGGDIEYYLNYNMALSYPHSDVKCGCSYYLYVTSGGELCNIPGSCGGASECGAQNIKDSCGQSTDTSSGFPFCQRWLEITRSQMTKILSASGSTI